MNRKGVFVVITLFICTANVGCVSRAIREGAGAVRGASGKVVELQAPSSLAHYRGLTIESITVAEGLGVPSDLVTLVRQSYADAAKDLVLTSAGSPALAVSGEIIHYESGGAVSKAIGPLQEIIVRTQLIDAGSKQFLGEANLVGRSKALTSGGAHNLAEGAGKALAKWLRDSGAKKDDG
ncbi:MAG: hypothetical protein O7D91_16380 [Planctomycetota bacterium]|nr:hypothetical protein [Planctomycetota bacterium]